MEVRRHHADGVRSEAMFSACGRYRYSLARNWGGAPRLGFVMLNPSTADERANDPTVARCQRRAREAGAGGLIVVNLFAWRATDPRALAKADDPVGPANDTAIIDCLAGTGHVICAWGNLGAWRGRAAAVGWALRATGHELWHLGLTQQGEPRHPLYVGAAMMPKAWMPEPRCIRV